MITRTHRLERSVSGLEIGETQLAKRDIVLSMPAFVVAAIFVGHRLEGFECGSIFLFRGGKGDDVRVRERTLTRAHDTVILPERLGQEHLCRCGLPAAVDGEPAKKERRPHDHEAAIDEVLLVGHPQARTLSSQ